MNFIAFSNIQQSSLKKIFELELDSLTCPSIQVRGFPDNLEDLKDLKEDRTFNSFGDISFIFNKKNIFGKHSTIPKNDATHQIYTGDAYTLRFPDIAFSIDVKILNNFIKEINSVYEYENVSQYIFDDFERNLKRNHKDKYRIKDDLKNSLSIKFLFLKEAGLLDDFKVFKIKANKLTTETQNDSELKALLKETNILTIRKNPEKYIQFINNKYKSLSNPEDKELWNAYCFDNDNNPSPTLFFKSFKNDINILRKDVKVSTDTEKTNKLLSKLLTKSEKILNISFEDFLEDNLNKIFKNPKIKENNKPLTPENIVSYMKRQRGSGEEQGNFGGYNRVSGKHQSIIRSYEDMVHNIDNLVTEVELKNYDLRIDNKISYISSKLDAYDQNFIDIIGYLGKDPMLEKVKEKLKNTNFDTENPLLLIEIQELAKLNNNRKHSYYEAKPNKAFYFEKHQNLEDEILTYVVVPNNIDKNLLKKLEKTDLKIVKYNANTDNSLSRLKSMYQCRETLIKEDKKLQIKNKIKI
jgi:hypothetical protein